MASRNKFEINGVIDTSNNVLDNIQLLATASGCFVTWDPSAGKWSVIVNEAGTSVKSFDDSNILGNINVGGSGINELYNSVLIEYPHKDLRDATDYITIETPTADRFEGELDNQLNIRLNCINDPVQAQIIATQELKQNRVDKIIQFASDFTANGIQAGDIVDVTADSHSYTNKLFRVIQIDEEDNDEGAIIYSITALEYDADVYVADLSRDLRTKRNGIVPKIMNEAAEASDDIDAGASIGRLLAANAAAKIFNSLLGSLFGDPTAEGRLTPEQVKEAADQAAFLNSTKKPPLVHSASTSAVCEGGSVTINFSNSECSSCFFEVPDYEYPYTITGISAADISIPLEGTVSVTGGSGSISFNTTIDGDAAETLTFTCGENSSEVVIQPVGSYSYESISADNESISEGDTVVITVTSAGIANGTTKPYTISGSAAGKVTSPALSGTVTFNSNQATLTIVTNNDSVYTGGQSLSVEIEPGFVNPCAVNNERTISISVADDESAPPADFTCEYVQVPVVWCGTFDGTTQYLKSMSVRSYALLPVAPVGGITVPLTVSVTNPGTSSAAISINSTVKVDNVTGLGGHQIDVITSFDPAPGGGDTAITGTTSTFKGY